MNKPEPDDLVVAVPEGDSEARRMAEQIMERRRRNFGSANPVAVLRERIVAAGGEVNAEAFDRAEKYVAEPVPVPVKRRRPPRAGHNIGRAAQRKLDAKLAARLYHDPRKLQIRVNAHNARRDPRLNLNRHFRRDEDQVIRKALRQGRKAKRRQAKGAARAHARERARLIRGGRLAGLTAAAAVQDADLVLAARARKGNA